MTSTIVDGSTVEDAVSKLDWRDGDLIMVGSSRLSAPKRLFLGSTAAKMLRVLDVPMMVVPRDQLDGEACLRKGAWSRSTCGVSHSQDVLAYATPRWSMRSYADRTNVRYTGAMGWHTGPPSWTEMERVLTGKPRRAGWPIDEQIGDGGDSPAWSRKRGSYQPLDVQRPSGSSVPYAELHAHSAYSFLDGASTPEELVEEAARLDLRAIALTDHDGLYGVVRFAEAAKELDVRTVFGAELSLGGGDRTEEPDPRGPHLLVLARGPEGYRRLSRQLATAHLAGGEKGVLRYDYDALTEAAGGHWHILTGCRKGHVRQALSDGGPEAAEKALADLVDRFGRDRVSIELTHHGHPLDDERNAALAELAPRFGLGVVATTAAHFAEPSRGQAGDGHGGDPGPQLDRRGGGLPCSAGRFASAVGGGDGAAVRRVARRW